MKGIPNTIHGLRVITIDEAISTGFQSITTGIHRTTEADILKSVAKGRNPDRAAWIIIDSDRVELALKREDVSNLADHLVGGFVG
ncbi:MAG: hypothetical protein ABIS50_11370 [Luteolibacter sp.]|uniref:hypothetical protein n=1 Tax=Luteolibacter sp. TaxID=1962973 RepID=UPI00326506E7